jgi:molybdopterin-guanine dinucleotide biosynthesis protein MobB
LKIAAIAGSSNTGKTTLLVALIERLVARGVRVAAIKHTHHELNDRDEGDTAKFRAAGAHPVILAGDGEAIVFGGEKFEYDDPRELLNHIDADVVLVEGFKSYDGWPRIDRAADDLDSIVDRILAP